MNYILMNRTFFIYIIYLFFFGCANVGNPSGGPRDEQPPVLDSLRSTKNLQTNFEKQRITLVFDEFVDLKDVFNQVIVSPPLAKRPMITKKKRTIFFDFHKDEVLRPDATYTINFGAAVVDFTEGNPVPDLRFVFATGYLIDSLEIAGNITDALTGEPAKDVLLMLYDNLSDTVVKTERPFYFAKTGENGRFQIGNIKSDTFKVFALTDKNLNYLYDQESEMIGFPDGFITLSGDSSLVVLPPIRLFQELPPLKIINKNLQPGLLKLAFNQTPQNIGFRFEPDVENAIFEYENDTVKVWYDWRGDEQGRLFVNKDTSFFDTLAVEPGDKESFLTKRKLRPVTARKDQIVKFNPTQPIAIRMNHPIAAADTSKIVVVKDSVTFSNISELVLNQRELQLRWKWEEDSTYILKILPGALTDIYGLSNADTFSMNYQASPLKEFGNIAVTVNGLDSLKSYVIQLFFKNNDKLVKEFSIGGLSTFVRIFNTLTPGAYYIRIITDLNSNGRWDTGNYILKRQPEPIFTVNLKELRANWDVEEEITLTE